VKSLVTTLIVAPDELSRAGLLGMLTRTRYKAIAAKSGWEAAIDSGKTMPSLAILILSGSMSDDPAAVASTIEAIANRLKVIVLADHCEPKLIRSALCAGAVAYLPRSISVETLLHTLDLAVDGEIVFPASLAREVLTVCMQG
jgi:DNA-binding NarL/FixJ family response regulator